MSNLALVTDNMLPVANETFIDNLSAGISAGAAIVPINSLAEYADGDSVILTVDPGTASQATFIGEKQGNTVINCKWTEGNVGASHAAGATVIDYDSSTHYNVLTKVLRMTHTETGTLKTTAVQAALNISSAVPSDYTILAQTATTITPNGNRSYSMLFPGVNYTDRLSPGMRLRTVRSAAAPTQCASLNGTNQYLSKATPAGMTFTDDFAVSAWVKLSAYPPAGNAGAIVSRYNGTSGFRIHVEASGQIALVGYNAGSANYRLVQSYQSLPLNKWVHVAGQLDMSAHTATSTTSYMMFDGVDVPATVNQAGTNPTAFVQAGNLEIGSSNGSLFLNGKIAQVAIFNAKVTQATMRGYMSQGLTGTETSLVTAYSLSNSLNDLNITNANNLTANGGATATMADSPFGGQADGSISATVDYGIIQKVTYGAPDTTVVLQVPEGCTIPTSGGVASVGYSQFKVPYGFPADRSKWIIQSIGKTAIPQTSPVNGVWYNIGSIQLNIPIGAWQVTNKHSLEIALGGAGFTAFKTTLSTTNNSETLSEFTTAQYGSSATTAFQNSGNVVGYISPSTATQYYALYAANAGGVSAMTTQGNSSPLIITAENAYL